MADDEKKPKPSPDKGTEDKPTSGDALKKKILPTTPPPPPTK